jgi:hypothetical protein
MASVTIISVYELCVISRRNTICLTSITGSKTSTQEFLIGPSRPKLCLWCPDIALQIPVSVNQRRGKRMQEVVQGGTWEILVWLCQIRVMLGQCCVCTWQIGQTGGQKISAVISPHHAKPSVDMLQLQEGGVNLGKTERGWWHRGH